MGVKTYDFPPYPFFKKIIHFPGPPENESFDAGPATVLPERALRLGALPPAILLRPEALHEKRIH